MKRNSLVTQDFIKATDIKSSFKDKCNDLMLEAMKLKEKIELLKTGISDMEKMEPLDDAYAGCEVVIHHFEDLIQGSDKQKEPDKEESGSANEEED